MKKTLVTAILLLNAFAIFAQMPATITPAEKVYGLSEFWQEVNYNFVYINKVNRKAWDSLYMAMIPIVEQTKNDYEYYHEMQRFCAFLKDGHTDVYFPQKIQGALFNTMFGSYRLYVENIGGKAIITHVNTSKKDEVPPGSEIVSVNGLPTAQYIAQYVSPYISSSTDYVRQDWACRQLLQGLGDQKYDLSIKTPAGKVKQLSVAHTKTEEKDIFPVYTDYKLFDLKWYPGDVAYIALNSFEDQKIDTLFKQRLPELAKAQKLIIDLRNNGGGSTEIGAEILKYLTNDTTLYGSTSYTRVHESAFKAWGRYVSPKDTLFDLWKRKCYQDYNDKRYEKIDESSFSNDVKAPKIVVPTVILIGHNTASAAEDFLILAAKQKHMVKIGQNSFGSTGQPLELDLPGGGSARICTKKDTYPNGQEFVGYGVKPDIEVVPTVKDYLKNDDVALNSALKYLKNKSLQDNTAAKTAGM